MFCILYLYMLLDADSHNTEAYDLRQKRIAREFGVFEAKNVEFTEAHQDILQKEICQNDSMR